MKRSTTFFLLLLCLSMSKYAHCQTYFTQGTVNNNYSQARDLNVITGSANPDTALSIANSVYGANTSAGWNGWSTQNMPAGVAYGLGFTFANIVSNTNSAPTYAVQFLGATDDSSLYYRFNTAGWEQGNTAYNGWGPWCRIWNSMDDGEGSGLDADLIRGSVPQWATNSSGNVYNTNSGYIGIGTANPQSLFSVEGTITAKVLNVTQTNWSDFVFDSAYKRMPLNKVASYVREYKHLPDIPSAVQIGQRGLDIGAMERLQMQKLEELALYAIDADKRIKQQDSTIALQQRELQEEHNCNNVEKQLLEKLEQRLELVEGKINILSTIGE